MRIKLTILSFIFSITLFGQVTFRQVAFYTPIAVLVSIPLFDRFWTYEDRQTDGLYFSQGLDPKMIFDGTGLDCQERLFARYGRFEPSINYEFFSNIDYQGLGFGAGYAVINRKVSLITGLETTFIWNQFQHVQSYGMNAEIRYIINDRFSFSYLGNIKTRPELKSKHSVYSGYLLVNVKL